MHPQGCYLTKVGMEVVVPDRGAMVEGSETVALPMKPQVLEMEAQKQPALPTFLSILLLQKTS